MYMYIDALLGLLGTTELGAQSVLLQIDSIWFQVRQILLSLNHCTCIIKTAHYHMLVQCRYMLMVCSNRYRWVFRSPLPFVSVSTWVLVSQSRRKQSPDCQFPL